MKYMMLIAFFLLMSCAEKKSEITEIESIATLSLDSTNSFGSSLKLLGKEAISLNEAIKNKSFEIPIRLKGWVEKSCSKKGCWMIVKDKESQVRVKFHDYSFFVPLGFKEKDVIVEGELKQDVITEDERKHFAKDDGASDDEIAKISGDEKQYSFTATSVIVL